MSVRSALKIDKISLTIPIDCESREYLLQKLDELCQQGILEEDQYKRGELYTNYRNVYWLLISQNAKCSIQANPRASNYRFLRLEWNPSAPSNTTSSTAENIRSVLSECIPNFSGQTLLQAYVTRIDITFDLRRVRIDSISVFSKLRKSTSGRYIQTYLEFTPRGTLDALHIGRYQSDEYLLIYDKREQMRSRLKNTKPAGARRFEVHWTRVELRLRDQGMLSEFLQRDNPWRKFCFRYYSTKKLNCSFEWKFFIDSCRVRGTQAALSLIEDNKERMKYRTMLQEMAPPLWWNPDLIWEERYAAICAALPLQNIPTSLLNS